MMKVRDKLKRILSFGLASNVIAVAQSVLLARVLGPEARGEISIVVTFVILTLPLATIGMKQNLAYVSTLLERKVGMASLATVNLLCVFACVVFSGIYAALLSQDSVISTFFVFALLLLRVVADVNSFMLLVNKLSHTLSLLLFIRSVLELAAIVVLFWFGVRDVGSVIGMYILSSLLYLLLILGTLNQVKASNSKELTARLKLSFAFFRRGIGYAIPLFLITVNTSFDILLLARLSSPESVGLYQVAVSVASLLWVIPTMMGGLLFSESLHLDLAHLIKKLLRYYYLLGCGALVLLLPIMISEPVFVLVFGEPFLVSSTVFNILLPGYYAMLVYKLANGIFASKGLVRAPIIIFLVTAALNIALNLALIPDYHEIGAAWATLASYFFCSVLFVLYTRWLNNGNFKNLSV